MRVFVTGHLGYVGVHLVDLLKQEGHTVVGCDLNLFEGCACAPFTRPHLELFQDIRTVSSEVLEGIDCVIHLAALSNDPMGDLNPKITESINRDGTLLLAKAAKLAGVPLFLFASSCSIYGKGKKLDVDERGKTAPLTPYARSKIEAEEGLEALSDAKFKTVSLRSATAYGYSPMLRIDLVVNNLLACAAARGEIRVMSDGSSWRPLIHCRDIARAFVAFLERPPSDPATVVNVGSNRENYQVKSVAAKVRSRLPETKLLFTGEVGVDPRSYRVNFDRLSELLPKFELSYTLESGIDDLLAKYRELQFSAQEFDGDRFVRLRTLKNRLERVVDGVH